MVESTFATSLVVLPLSFVGTSVTPRHRAFAVSHTSLPFASIDGPRRVIVCSCFDWSIWIELLSRQGFLCLYSLEVPGRAQVLDLLYSVFPSLDPSSDHGLDPDKGHHILCCDFFQLFLLFGTPWRCLGHGCRVLDKDHCLLALPCWRQFRLKFEAIRSPRFLATALAHVHRLIIYLGTQ